MYYNVTLRRVHKTIVTVEAIRITYFCVCVCVCVRECMCEVVGARTLACACTRVALLIQHAMRRHITSCSLWLHQIF